MKKFTSFETQLGESVVLTDKAKLSLYKKSQNSGISVDILEEVYRRGHNCWTEQFGNTPEQFAFERVNSFIAGGFAVELDEDLRKACWKGYEAIGMKMKNGKKVPNCVPVKEEELNKSVMTPVQLANKHGVSVESINKALKKGIEVEKEHTTHHEEARRIALAHLGEKPNYYTKLDKAGLEEEDAEKHSKDFRKPASRFDGSDELVAIYKKQTPGQIIRRVVKEAAAQYVPPTYQPPAEMQVQKAPQRTLKTNVNIRDIAPKSERSGTGTGRFSPRTSSGGYNTLKPTTTDVKRNISNRFNPSFGQQGTGSLKASSVKTSTSLSQGGVDVGRKMSSSKQTSPIVKGLSTAGREAAATAAKAAPAVAKGLSAALKFAGPVGAAVGLVADAKPLNKGEDELGRQKSLGITKPNVTPGMGSTKNIEPVKGGAITTKAPDYYKGKVGDYTVKAGDTLSGIASKTGQSVADLASKNKFDSENKIAAGSKLFTGSVPTPPVKPEWESGGKAKKIKEAISEATYKGKTVPLNKPMKGDVKKSKVFVDPDGDGKAQKVNFGDKTLSIKKNIPARKKSYCARSSGQGNLTDKTSANYWSRRAWNCEETEVNELSVPAGTTGKRKEVSTPLVPVRMADGSIKRLPPGKSGSSGGGGDE